MPLRSRRRFVTAGSTVRPVAAMRARTCSASRRVAVGACGRTHVGIVERLTAEGRMHPQGLSEVARAKADGRWEAAYAGPATAEIPADLTEALAARPEARRCSRISPARPLCRTAPSRCRQAAGDASPSDRAVRRHVGSWRDVLPAAQTPGSGLGDRVTMRPARHEAPTRRQLEPPTSNNSALRQRSPTALSRPRSAPKDLRHSGSASACVPGSSQGPCQRHRGDRQARAGRDDGREDIEHHTAAPLGATCRQRNSSRSTPACPRARS